MATHAKRMNTISRLTKKERLASAAGGTSPTGGSRHQSQMMAYSQVPMKGRNTTMSKTIETSHTTADATSSNLRTLGNP